MRRKDKEITDINEIIDIVRKNSVCRIAMCNNNKPYIVPMNYGYTYENNKLKLFFHSAKEGKKIEFLKTNPYVFIEIDCNHTLIEANSPCAHSFAFECVMGEGEISFIENIEDKKACLSTIMLCLTKKDFTFTDEQVKNIDVLCLEVENLTGKRKLVEEVPKI